MDDAQVRSASAEIIRLVIDQLLADKARPPAEPDQDLGEAGLSSLDIVNVMLALEDALDISLPAEELTAANFRTVQSIEAMVARVV